MSAYLTIGLWAGFFAAKNHYIPKQFIVTAAFGFIAIFYYLVFFLTLANPSWGHSFNYVIYIVGWGLALYSLLNIKRLLRQRSLAICILLPLSIMLLLTGYYTVLLTSCRISIVNSQRDDNSTYCHLHSLPGDNELPYLYAQNVIHRESHALISDWKLADRPPIQIGAGLGMFNLNNDSSSGGYRGYESYRGYQLVATFLQLSWVAAIFGLLITLGIRLRQTILAIGIMSMSGFVYINSVFVWPKFFAAGLVVMACVLLFDTGRKHYNRGLVSAITALGLGLLIHDGIIFTMLGAGIVLGYIFLRGNPPKTNKRVGHIPWRSILAGCLIALLFISPWLIYKNHNTSSDRLVKWHLAGVVATDNRTTTQTIVDSYKHIGLHTWYENRVANLQMLAVPMEKQQLSTGTTDFGFSAAAIKQSLGYLATWYEQNDFYILLFALGVFNVGWIAAFSRKNRSKISVLEKRLLAASFISIAVWVLVMFLPYSTVLHQGSYATMLILFGLLAAWIARNNLLLPLFIIQLLVFEVFWVIGVYSRYTQSLHGAVPAVLVSLLFAVILLALAKMSEKWQAVYKLRD